MCDFLARFGMHGTCMCVFSSLAVIGMGFARFDNDFQPYFSIYFIHLAVKSLHISLKIAYEMVS